MMFTAAFSRDPVTITIWAMGEEGLNLEKITPRFEMENPDIKVKVVQIPWNLAYDKLITAVAGGTAPDLAQVGTTWMAAFAAMDALLPLDKFIARSTIISPDRFFAGSWNTCLVKGKVYGIPWYVDVRVLYYRTDILQAAGFEHPPSTWEELFEVARVLAEKGDYGLALSPHWQEFLPFVWQAGGDVLNETLTRPRVTEPEFITALEFFVSLFQNGFAPIGETIDLFEAFRTGFYPMFFSGPWMVKLISTRLPDIEGKWSVALMPKKVTRASFVGGSNWCIFSGTKYADQCWRFIEFMSRPDIQVEWYRILTSLPAVKEAWQDPLLAEGPMMGVFRAQLEEAVAPPPTPAWEEIAQALITRVEEAVRGVRSPVEAAQLLDQDIKAILARL
jgi:multiple sugar transport system substrate-binding protein